MRAALLLLLGGCLLWFVWHSLEANKRRAQSDLEDLNAIWDNDRAVAVVKTIQLQQRFTVLQRWMDILGELQFELEN